MVETKLNESLLEAVKCGRYDHIKGKLMSCSKEEIEEILSFRYDEVCSIHRLSNGRIIRIIKPTALMLAVVNGFSELLEYLCAFRVALDRHCEVEDNTYKQMSYTAVTALHIAAIQGKVIMLKKLAEYGANVNCRNSVGATPLFECCSEGHSLALEELLSFHADPEIPNDHGVTCLMIAAHSDDPVIIKTLVSYGVDISQTDKDGRNVLFYTTCSGRLDTLVYLLDKNAQIVSDKHKISLLMEAVSHEQQEIAHYLLSYHQHLKIHVHRTDDAGRNVLFYLSHTAQIKLLEDLVKFGVKHSPANDDRTLLMAASLHNNHKLINYLLKHKNTLHLDIKANDNKGRNVLFYCITGGDIKLFKTFIEHGVEIETSSEGITLLMQAVAKHRQDYIEYFLSTPKDTLPDIQAKDKDGWNAVFYAVASNYSDILSILLDNGASPVAAQDGRTVIMQAALKGDIGFVEKIIHVAGEFDVDINDRDSDGWSAIWYTIPGNRIDVFDLLLARGGKLCSAVNGSTVLHEAVDKGKQDMIVHLLDNKDKLELDVTQMDSQGNNAAMYAAATGNKNVLKLLLEHGVPIEADSHGRSILMHACVNGDVGTVTYLMELSTWQQYILKLDNDNRNALFYCIDGDSREVLEYLIKTGMEPISDHNGRSLLMHAASAGNKDMCEYLLENKELTATDVNQVDSHGENALFYASRGKKWPIVQLLLKHGVKFNSNKFGVNILSKCIQDHGENAFEEICSTNADYIIDVNGKDTKGMTVFHHCVMRNDLELLKKFAPDFDPEKDADVHGITSAMRACYVNNFEILKFILSNFKIDLTLRDDFNRDALFHSVLAGNIKAVRYLLTMVKQHSEDVNGRTVLMVAAKEGSSKLVDLLLRSSLGRSLLHKKDRNQQTAVHLSSVHGRLGVLSILERYSANLDSKDIIGATPIMYASLSGHVTTLQFLLRKNSLVHTQNVKGENALHYCFHNYPNARCMKLLVKFGINLNQQDRYGVTPLMLLCKKWSNTHISSIKYLLDEGADTILQDKKVNDVLDYCPWDAEYVKQLIRQASAISETEELALEDFASFLPNDMDLTKILTELQKEHILTPTLYFEIVKQAQEDRVEKLLEILETRGPKAFPTFCKVLKMNGFAELSYNLCKTAFKKSVEVFV